MNTEYEVIIGLEIHAQISSKTKMFCGCDNDSFGKEPNTNVCPVCMGFPGMLPVPNKDAVEKGVKAALALGCEIPLHSKFDRKNYFYPDLPTGFQISQFDEPVSVKGQVTIQTEAGLKKVGITRLHLENDAGKLTHTGPNTLLDYNRAGTPLMEIVSEPDMRSAKEARAYAEAIQKILRYTKSSDCDMEKGMMRFDASVSLRPMGENKLYPRAEIKNLNSFRSLEAAIEYEIKRQKKMWQAGAPLATEQTVGWDDERATTELLREKESAADYRYFPEPDLPPLEITPEQVEAWKATLPELPDAKHQRLMAEWGITEAEATFYVEDPTLADFFEAVARESKNPKSASAFVGTLLIKRLRDANLSIENSPVSAQHLAQLIQLIDVGTISNNVAKSTVMDAMMESGKTPQAIVDEQGLAQVSDSSALEALCQQAIAENPVAAQDVKEGKMKAMGALVGTVMKLSKGQANPQMVNTLLEKLLV